MPVAPLDLVLLVVYIAGTVAFGLWMGRGQKSASDYLLGGRDLPWGVLLLSIVATETSTVTFLSVPGIAFGGGLGPGDLRFLQLPLGYLVGRIAAALFLVPLYFRGELFTAYDVLRDRSGPHVRTLASGLFLVTRTLGDGLRLYLTALVLQVMFGWSTPTAVIAVGAATVVYTVLGGIKAVVWTDAIQFVVYMLGAAIAFAVLGSEIDGGLGAVFSSDGMQDRLRVFVTEWDLAAPYTLWAGIIGGTVVSIGSHGVDQLIVQRYLCARSQRDAQKALIWSGPVVLAQFAVFLLLGLCLSAFYTQHPPETPFEKGDRVFADFIVNHMPTGIVGIVLGALFSAAMSTLSSSLSASASALVNDFVLPITKHRPDDPFALRAAKFATVVFAGLQILVGISGIGGGSIIGQVLAIQSLTLGVILGLFVLALGERRNPTASLVGLCAGLAVTGVIAFVLPIELEDGSTFAIGWPWFGLITGATPIVVGVLARPLTRPA
ncbi:MAG: sodium:solute symporter [Planctomycetes bacterium]|nr:sodium:solute symporter [Planctomycetota bacterium]